MFEKIKDLIYDISDYLVTIIIVFFIVISIAFVMTKSYGLDFSKNDLLSLFQKEANITKEEIKPPVTPPAVVKPETPTPTPTPTPAPAPTQEEKDKAEEEKTEILIEVYPGDGSYDVGERLVDAGVIKDSDEFAITLVERNLDTDLQVGEYTFKKDMTIDQVIEVFFP
ncbi:MAG: endolytic transglycosylase MltG [Tissierellia bacterium]|nr:endolytic transglycosylase MltG [Tissierellia bacterium]